MMTIRCHIDGSYLLIHVAGLLEEQGLLLHEIGKGDRDDLKTMIVIGSIAVENIHKLWRVRGLKLIQEIVNE